MKVIAFDTSGPVITAGIAMDGCVLAEVGHRAERARGNLLELAIDEVLRRTDWSRRDVEGIGIVTGPGSLTALRIGWATAAAWAQSASLPVTGWKLPDVHHRAHGSRSESMGCCVHYRGDHFLLYRLANPQRQPESLRLAETRRVANPPSVLSGPAVLTHRAQLAEMFGHATHIVPDAEAIIGGGTLALWAEEDILNGQTVRLDNAPIEYGLPPDFKKTAIV